MKQNYRAAMVLLCMVGGLAGCASSGTQPVSVQAGTQPINVTVEQPSATANIITVTGKEDVKVVPDMAQVIYAVHTQAETAGACQEQNGADLERAIETLKGLGIEETSIQTSSYGMNPIRNWNSSKQEITGYEMDTRITVTDIPMEQLGKVLAGSVNAGVNRVESVSYFSSNYDESYQQALKLAVDMARRKADTLAEAGGRTVSAVLAVREDGYMPQTRYGAQNASMETMKAGAGAADMAVMPGEISVEAQVSVDFLLQ